MPTTATATRWALKGQGYEFCNCDFGCACNFGSFPNSKDGSRPVCSANFLTIRATSTGESLYGCTFSCRVSDRRDLSRSECRSYGPGLPGQSYSVGV